MRLLVISILAFAALGCNEAKIPLFNPLAKPVNRLASADELITELNNEVVSLRDSGFITQSFIDKYYIPNKNRAESISDEAKVIIKNGDPTGGGKVEELSSLLRALRNELARIRSANVQASINFNVFDRRLTSWPSLPIRSALPST